MQAIAREAFQQTVTEHDSAHRRPTEFAEAWKACLAALLALESVEVPGWGEITIADLDADLGWSLYAAASRARAEKIARATATPSRCRDTDDGPTLPFDFSVTADGDGSLGRRPSCPSDRRPS